MSRYPEVSGADVEAYIDAVRVGDRRGAIGIATALLDRGVAADRVVSDLLARAQSDVGRGWQDARWSIAMEHRATAITESALQIVVERGVALLPAAPGTDEPAPMTVLCAEGEWHTLPARMAAEVMRLRGVDVWFVGPSLPASELAAFFGDSPPAAVAVACALPFNLVGAWRTVSALREIGVHIICGGRGFGPDGRWAARVGADAWAPDFAAGADLLAAAATAPARLPRRPVEDPDVSLELGRLRRDAVPLVEQAVAVMLAELPEKRLEPVVSATRSDLAATLQAVASAVVVDDVDVVATYAGWFQAVLLARGLPTDYAGAAFGSLERVLPSELHRAQAMAAAGLAACGLP